MIHVRNINNWSSE